MTRWAIRPEVPDDAEVIARVIEVAFAGAEHSDGNEAQIVERLRAGGDLTVSLVAEDDGIAGQVAFSPVSISDGAEGWFGLGPVAVVPERQGEGIGTALIEAGLSELRRRGANGCVVLGNPGFYAHFGFKHDPSISYPGPPPEYFQCLLLKGEKPRGEVRYAAAFG